MARHPHMRRILLVEDDPDVRDALRLVLDQAGYEVVCAGEGREALDRLRESMPALSSACSSCRIRRSRRSR